MTFDEWFEQRFPPVAPHMFVVRESFREIAHEAWIAGADHQDQFHEEMRRLGYD